MEKTVPYISPLNQVLIAIEYAYVNIINIFIDLYYRLVYAILKFIIENELTKTSIIFNARLIPIDNLII